jgi:MoaA/NifB/PqqE/SkfB family radical SAM enzyme
MHDAWLHWSVTDRCNLNCHYCISFDSDAKTHDEIFKIDIPALIKTLDKTNKVFRIGFVGGEPFLIPNIVEACTEITKKHYISFNTNLTSSNIKEFSKKINPEKVLGIHASLHIKELEKHNLLNRYIDNFLLCKEKGFVINAVEVAHPSLLSQVKEYKKKFQRKKINIKFGEYIGEYNGKKYPESYTTKERNIFALSKENIKVHNQKGKVCNAGYNVGIVCQNGDIFQCYEIREKLGNIYEENIIFKDKPIICPIEFCGCPLKSYDEHLFEKATGIKSNRFSVIGLLTRRIDAREVPELLTKILTRSIKMFSPRS